MSKAYTEFKVVRVCGHALAGDGVVLHDKGTVVCMGLCYKNSLHS